MSVLVSFGQNWGRGASEGENKGNGLAGDVHREEAVNTSVQIFGSLSLCTRAVIKQVNIKTKKNS